jgi:hypothetical protein
MKSLTEIDATLAEFEKKFGLGARGAAQQSEAWFHMKLGVISASNAAKAVAKRDSEMRATYMAELIAQVCTGVIKEFSTKEMDWGKEQEDAARACYELATGEKITNVPFVFKDSTFRAGCSPDGFAGSRPTEIKCPWNSANYVKFLIADKLKPEWHWQTQFILWVTGADGMDMTHYDPRMKVKPIHIVPIEKDARAQAQIEEMIPAFISDMDTILAKIGVKFGSHWLRIAQKLKESA